MATGYTHPVKDGTVTDFKEFATNCARAFGANILMRDEPSGVPIKEYEVESYYYNRVERAREELKRVQSLTDSQWLDEYEKFYEKSDENTRKYLEDSRVSVERYEAMLEKVKAWIPPSEEHDGLKNFMIQQLAESIEYDKTSMTFAKREIFQIWVTERINDATAEVRRALQSLADETERIEGRNRWNRLLFASLEAE